MSASMHNKAGVETIQNTYALPPCQVFSTFAKPPCSALGHAGVFTTQEKRTAMYLYHYYCIRACWGIPIYYPV